jgi:hypothetical protein
LPSTATRLTVYGSAIVASTANGPLAGRGDVAGDDEPSADAGADWLAVVFGDGDVAPSCLDPPHAPAMIAAARPNAAIAAALGWKG